MLWPYGLHRKAHLKNSCATLLDRVPTVILPDPHRASCMRTARKKAFSVALYMLPAEAKACTECGASRKENPEGSR